MARTRGWIGMEGSQIEMTFSIIFSARGEPASRLITRDGEKAGASYCPLSTVSPPPSPLSPLPHLPPSRFLSLVRIPCLHPVTPRGR